MKHIFRITLIIIVLSSFFAQAQTTAIPDTIFENYLETHDEDGAVVSIGDAASMGDGIANNGLVLTNSISGVTFLDVGDLGISDLSGIEDFTAIETLICSNNNLTTLNVDNNTNLVSLLCGSNFLQNLAVSNIVSLESLTCSDNQIQNLDVSNNSNLLSLTASGNQLSTIDVSNNTNLTFLSVSNNRLLGELIVSNNTHLEGLFCASNQISVLDLSANTVLKNLDVSNNALTDLDLSAINTVVCPDPQTDPVTQCQGVGLVNVSRNQLTSLVVANGYNELVSLFDASDNTDLSCIQIDNGFTPSGWIKDDWVYFTENVCADIYTYVPDDNFEQALINQGYDDALDNLVLTSSVSTITDLNISNSSISSLVGIEDFISLETLDCSTNSIEIIDLSNNPALLQIDVTNNDLLELDVSANSALTTLYCASNFIDAIDLSNNTALTILNCSNNSLTSLEVSQNVLLNDLDCSFNQIESLDIIYNTSLVSLLSNDNNLFALRINNGSNNLISTFIATNNVNLFCIEVDDVTFANTAIGWQKDASAAYNLDCGTYVPDDNFEQALIDQGIDSDNTLNNFVATTDIVAFAMPLDISGLSISDLTGIQDFTALQELNCSDNNLTFLDLSANTALQILDCSNNEIEDLDLTTNTALTSIRCNDNSLLNLNVENGNNGALTIFNTTNNPNLYCINIDDALVASIPGSWQKDAFAIYDGDCTNNRFTIIPDAFFEQALIDFGYDDVIDAQVLTSNIEHILSLDVSSKSISDLTGIQDFKSLLELNCSGNFLEALDVSEMQYLERLNCSSNYFLTNDVNDINGLLNTTGTTNLIELYCSNNNLNNLDTSLNLNLQLLDCADNNLSTLNINNNTVLRILNCSNNELTNLDISTNASLEDVNCSSNQLNDLSTFGTNNTTLITLNCANNNLSNMLINSYAALETLNCGSNELADIDVSNNLALNFLSISNNQISNLNLLNNTDLVELYASQNNFSLLNVSANSILEQLNCDYNEITQLELASNTLLKFLSSSNNQISELDLSNNTNLIEVNISSNLISDLELSNNLVTLKSLNVSSNQIEGDIDLSSMAISACVFQPNQTEYCPETITINLSNNLFSFVNIQNGINTDITNFNTSGNPNLSCIQVDDANNIGLNWIKDSGTTYNEDCNYGETYVPDDNFEQALIDLGYDSGPLNDYVPTLNIESLISLDVSGNNIADLTGIEDFAALEILNCSNNALNELNVSSNINLINLDCSNNLLADLETLSNIALVTLNCSTNAISSLNLSANTSLTNLNISDNAFTVFSSNEVLSLQVFNCDNNAILELDFQQNLALTNLSCESNSLETLNIKNGQNSILAELNAINNPNLNCIETDNGTVPAGSIWNIDATAQFAINCFFGETYVPDDNFEQALIDLGYDSGALDDYVLTENIEDVIFLNVSNREISDITGIEDFISLTALNIEDNSITALDLSTNTVLVDLDVSGNLISSLDISILLNLAVLDVSNNSFTQLNLNTNTALIDLDISNNLITIINVDFLVNLEDFNCAFNQLTSLDVTQNPNLNILFCQSNLLVADQLNIQNGNNENLQIFNATNNPDLGCILVDNPLAVIENTEGFYDDWLKDDTANYQTICEDADNDGIPNDDDLCPSTEFGAAVDLFGCAIIDLPNDNFTISITGETCLNSNNGKVTIIAQELYSYTATLIGEQIMDGTGEVFYQEYNFTNDVDIFNLLADTYQMCITIEEWPDYQSCYTIIITEPNPLTVFASRNSSGNELSVDMSGSSSYHIEFNGITFTTHNSEITLQLEPGTNHLKVSTGLECQGIYEERIIMSNDFIVHPNPFNNIINIYDGKVGETINVNIYSSIGQLVLNKTFINQGTDMSIDTSSLSLGMYYVNVQSQSNMLSYKIIKK